MTSNTEFVSLLNCVMGGSESRIQVTRTNKPFFVDIGVIRVWVRIPVMTLVSLSKTLNYNRFSSPRCKWVSVRAEMVLVIDNSLVCFIYIFGCILPRELRWFQEINRWPSD